MDQTLVIILGVVLLAVVVFFVARKPKALPQVPSDRSKARLEPGADMRPLETDARQPLPATTAAAHPPSVDVSAKAKDVPAAKRPVDVPSSDVLPADESVPPPAMPKDSLAAPSVPRVSKREVAGMRAGLAASRTGFVARLSALFAGKKEIDPALLEQLEEVMLSSDVGVNTTRVILERLRDGLAKNELRDADAVWTALRSEATRLLTVEGVRGGRIQGKGKPVVVLMVGVNGVGKTTTIGKLATRFANDGRKVVLGAGDTFRAAAVQQLEVWGKRVGAEVVRGKDGADPGAVAFDATTRAKDIGADVLLIDTAGRLHTKAPLMDEIKKVRKSIAKALDGAPHETLLVVDATTGHNALTQAVMFKEAIDLTGIILTKLDGTAKGGIVLAICDELKVPVRYVGLGERAEDLREFHAEDFVEALFGRDTDEAAAA
jgi:fused signal recognition particle receptor